MLVAGNHTSIVTPSAIAAAGVRVGDEATATGELLGEDDEDFVDVDDFALDTQVGTAGCRHPTARARRCPRASS